MSDSSDNPRALASASLAAVRAWGGALVIGATLATVAGVTGFISYTHICALTLSLHQSWKTAHLMPLAVDGQIVIGSVVYMSLPGRNRFWGLVGIAPGLAESLFANWESGISRGRLDASWATVAAQAFAVSSFLFERWLKAQAAKAGHAAPHAPVPEEASAAPAPAAAPAPGTAGTLTPDAALLALIGTGSQRDIAAMLGVPKTRVGRWKARLDQGGKVIPELSQDGPADAAPEPVLAGLNGATPGA